MRRPTLIIIDALLLIMSGGVIMQFNFFLAPAVTVGERREL